MLRWVDRGCPGGVFDGTFHRISAAALRRRGLIETSGRGSHWRAQITDIGREYLARSEGPDPPKPRQANASVTQQLVDDVIASGGSLWVQRRTWTEPDAIDYERRARLAELHSKVPAGKQLAVRVVSNSELEIELVDASGPAPQIEEETIEVPQRVARHHPASRAFRDTRERHQVSQRQLARATRIVHVIAREAEKRGWVAKSPSPAPNAYGRDTWTPGKQGNLRIEVDEEIFWLRLKEGGVHLRGTWEEEVSRHRNVDRESPWYRDRELPSGPFDADASGQLTLELHGASTWLFRGRRSRWGDRKRWQLEDCLGALFVEIEGRVAEATRDAEERRKAAQEAEALAKQRADEREREWHRHIEHAKELWSDSVRVEALGEQVGRWHEARVLSEFCEEIEAMHGAHAPTAEWLAWVRSYVDRLDLRDSPPTVPKLEEPSTDELQRFMPDGWSAQVPDSAGDPSAARRRYT